jgi:Na+/H+ antiporter NhaA
MRRLLPVLLIASLATGVLAAGQPGSALPNHAQSLKFAVLGDNGTGKQPQLDVATQMARAHQSFRFDLVLMLGDPATAHDPLSRFELWARHPVQAVLLLFGVIAAGVPIRALDWGTLGLPLATLVGKPMGLVLRVAVASAIGLHLPFRMGWRDVFVIGLVASVGFTVALFFATAAVGPGPTLSELKMGALMSAAGALAAIGVAALLRTGRFTA